MRIFMIAMLIILFSEPCFALRCTKTGKLIDVGTTKTEVLNWCGEPKTKEVIGESGTYKDRTGKSSYKSLIMEVWILDWKQNADSLDYRLLFKGDKLIELQHIR